MKWNLFLYLFFFSSKILFAQQHDDQLYFKHYLLEDGLSESSVNCIIQGNDASLWVGTDDGLNHFDGHEFVIYRYKANDPHSLSNNSIRSFAFDSLQNLWIGTSNGLNQYNSRNDNFTSFRDSSNSNNYRDILIDYARQRIWLADVDDGLKFLDLKSETIQIVKHPDLKDIQPWTFAFDSDNNLIVGTLNKGVFRFAPDQNRISFINTTKVKDEPTLSHNTVRALLVQNENLWIGTEGGGLNKLNLTTNELNVFSSTNKKLSNDLIWSLAIDKENQIWIGTDGGGLMILNEASGATITYKQSLDNSQSLSGNTLRTIYLDNESNAWLGTFNNGLNYMDQASRNFQHHAKSIEVSSLYETKNGTILVGTDGKGLLKFDSEKISLTKVDDIKCTKILAILEDHEGGLWFGTYQEGLHYKRGTDYKIYTIKNDSILDNTIWAIAEDHFGNIWIGTDNGPCWLDRTTGKFKTLKELKDYDEIFTSSLVRSIFVDSKGIIWLGLTSSLLKYNAKDKTYTYYENEANSKQVTISNSIMVSMIEKGDDLWIGTFGGGLNRLNIQTGEVKIYDEAYGLPNNTVFAVQQDGHGNIWMSTNKGIVKFDPDQNKFAVFGSEMGVQNKTFYVGSSIRSKNGEMFFGGNNGFSQFHPDKVISSIEKIKAGITGMMDKTSLTKPRPIVLDNNNELVLDYSLSRFLGFTVSAFHYLAPSEESYAYRLIGFDNTWRDIGSQRNLIFTNLNPGHYTLEVKAAVNNQWSDNITSLTIVIQSPWWMTYYFRGSILLLIILSVIIYYRIRTRNLRARKETLEKLVIEKSKEVQRQTDELLVQNEELTSQNEQIVQQANALQKAQDTLSQINNTLETTVEKRTEELRQAYKELDTFFYRSSHDFRRPLTTFMGLAEVAKISTTDQRALDLFKKVDETARSLDKMIHKLQSISDLEWQQMMYKEMDLKSLVDDVYYLYREELNQKNIQAVTDIQIKNVVTYPALLKIILENLIENAIQFSQGTSSRIVVRCRQNTDTIQIEVEDNGQGIDMEYQDKIFDMYFRASANSKGNGLGLYISKKAVNKLKGRIEFTSTLDVGSTFIIKLPLISSI